VLYVTAKGGALLERAKPLLRRLDGELDEGFAKAEAEIEAEIEVVLRFLNRTVERFVADGKRESS